MKARVSDKDSANKRKLLKKEEGTIIDRSNQFRGVCSSQC